MLVKQSSHSPARGPFACGSVTALLWCSHLLSAAFLRQKKVAHSLPRGGHPTSGAAHGQVLVRCRPQLPHEAAAAAVGLRTPKPFTPRATLPRPRSRNGLEGSSGGGGSDSARNLFEGPTQPPTLTVHDAGVLTIRQCMLWSARFALCKRPDNCRSVYAG